LELSLNIFELFGILFEFNLTTGFGLMPKSHLLS